MRFLKYILILFLALPAYADRESFNLTTMLNATKVCADNNIAFQGENTSGTCTNIIELNAADQIEIGSSDVLLKGTKVFFDDSGASATYAISSSTSDSDDDSVITLHHGTAAASLDGSRGSVLYIAGNEAGAGGLISLYSGSVAGSNIQLWGNASNSTIIMGTNNTTRWTLEGTGILYPSSSGKFVTPYGTALPATCWQGEVFHDTDSDDCADTGSGDGAICRCKTANTWVLVDNI